mmetsp:Transcript_1571/g.6194  ORF Transcript_1571/g.6194 Transcript_1571/m.6194 type:complete len:182 (+) Transcript_1571:267-812(+)
MQEAEFGRYPAGGPPGTAPAVFGMPIALPPGMAVVFPEELTAAEVVVLNYRLAVTCLAGIDFAFTLFNLFTLLTTSFLGVFALILLAGPVCGILGARRLNRKLVMVYLAFCLAKVIYQVFISFYFGFHNLGWFILLLLILLVQVWITKLVWAFWFALGAVDPARLVELLNNRGAPAHMVYW